MVRTLALSTAFLALTAATAGASTGALTQLAAPNGCLVDTSVTNASCTTARALDAVEALKLSPDGKTLYSYSYGNGSIGVFNRDAATGQLSQTAGATGCLQFSGLFGCTDTRGPTAGGDIDTVAMTPNGQFVYATGRGGSAMISAFSRDTTTGVLTELPLTAGCVSSNGTDASGGGGCATYSPLSNPNAATVSPDGKNLYVTMEATDKGMAVFSIASDGSLTPVQCINAVSGGGCVLFAPLKDPGAVIVSPDGKNVYAAGDDADAISVFSRDATTGALTALGGLSGCVSSTGSPGCTNGRGIEAPYALAISPDGTSVYEASIGSATAGIGGYLTVFSRDASTGALTQLSGTAGCFSANGASEDNAGTCTQARSMGQAYDLDVSPDGHNVYLSVYATSSVSAVNYGYPGFSVFARAADGSLTQLPGTDGCITSDGTSDGAAPCAAGQAVSGPVATEVSPDGKFVYGADYGSDAINVFSRILPQVPSCSAATVNVAHDTATSVPLTCTDADGDAITRAIGAAPGHGALGTIDQSAGTVTFTPTSGFSGDDTFTFIGSDRDGSSAAATVTLHVAAAPVTTPPVTTPPVTTPPPDTTAPHGTIGKVRTTLKKLRASGRLVVPVTADEACAVALRLVFRGRTIASKKTTFSAPGTKRITLRLSKKTRRALRRVRTLKLTLVTTFTDAAHNRSSARRRLTLRR